MSSSGSSYGSIQDNEPVQVDQGVLQRQQEQFEEIRQQQILQKFKEFCDANPTSGMDLSDLRTLVSTNSNTMSGQFTGKSVSIVRGESGEVFENDTLSRLTEDDPEVQKGLFRDENAGVKKSPHVVSSIIEWLKTNIFPYVKFWSDEERKFDYPDFVSKDRAVKEEQARVICEGLLKYIQSPHLGVITLDSKVRFWITYRSVVKKELVKYRCNASQQIKDLYVKGMGMCLNDLVLLLFY